VVADFKILTLDEAGEEGLGESETGLSMATGSNGEACRFPQKSPQPGHALAASINQNWHIPSVAIRYRHKRSKGEVIISQTMRGL
jgi:hypothetical protein